MKPTLWIIYSESDQTIHGDFGLHISLCASNKQQLDLDIMHEVFRDKLNREPHFLDRGRIGVFEGLEQLRAYCFHLAEKMAIEQLNIHNSKQLQQIIAEVNDASELRDFLGSKGELISLESADRSGLWGRIFN